MTWRDYIANLSPLQRDIILWKLLSYHLDDQAEKNSEISITEPSIRFTPGEDPNYQGTYTANAEIYWASNGDSLLSEETE
jgi:hypothetical protein